MKIIYTTDFNNFTRTDQNVLEELKSHGFKFTVLDWKEELDIKHYPHLNEIDLLFSKKDNNLMDLYKKIENLSNSNDALIATQNNVYHPQFIESLNNIYTVYYSGDDPDLSETCSKPYVKCYDHIFAAGVNFDKNTKVTEKFLEWGAKRADWWPLGFRDDEYDPHLKVEDIFNKKRKDDLAFVGEIIKRRNLLTKIKSSFPNMKIFSNLSTFKAKLLVNGYYSIKTKTLTWVNYLPLENLVPLYQNLKIGINHHTISGPSNVRTYQLPANGVMQICDCAEGINDVFKINKEVIVYNTVQEAIELIKYYLDNDEERKEIATNGYIRAVKNYNKKETFLSTLKIIEKNLIAE